MARRRTRRKNPMRSTGMLVVNPRRRTRRRKNSTKREMRYLWSRPKRTTTRRRRNTRKGGRRTTARRAYMKTNRRRRNTRKGGRRTTARRAYMKTNRRRRRNTSHRRRNRYFKSRRSKAAADRYLWSRRRNTRRRRRRNPSLKQSIAKIPFIGKPLAMMWGFLPQALIGAISVEPAMMVARLLGPMVGDKINASALYGIIGLGLATIVQYLPIKDKSFRDKLSVAVASAAGGVAFYKWRMGMDTTAAQETGLLQLHGAGTGFGALELFPGPLNGSMGALQLYPGPLNGYGDGMAYSVNPYPGAISNGAF